MHYFLNEYTSIRNCSRVLNAKQLNSTLNTVGKRMHYCKPLHPRELLYLPLVWLALAEVTYLDPAKTVYKTASLPERADCCNIWRHKMYATKVPVHAWRAYIPLCH